MTANKEVQQKYVEFQMLQQQMQAVHKQMEAVAEQAHEMDIVQNALDEFSRSKKGSDIFVTLTPGLFVKAKLEENDNVVLNVGGGAMVQKSIPQAKEIVASQGIELRKLQEEMAGQLKKIEEHVLKLQDELSVLVK